MKMRKVIALCVGVLALLFACGKGSKSTGPSNVPVFDNLGYGNTGGWSTGIAPDFVLIASYGLRWTVIDLGKGATGAMVRAARAAGLKVLFVPYNGNCVNNSSCHPDPVGLIRDLAVGGTDGIRVEVSETSDSQLIKNILDQWPGEKVTTAGFGTYPGALLDRHPCEPPTPPATPEFPIYVTDCTPNLTNFSSSWAAWAKVNPGVQVTVYSLAAQTEPSVLQRMRDAL